MKKSESIQKEEAIRKLLDVAGEMDEYRKLIEYAETTMSGQELAEEMVAVVSDLLLDAKEAMKAARVLLAIARRTPEPCIHGDLDCVDCLGMVARA